MTTRPTSGARPPMLTPPANFMVHTRKQLKYIVIGGAVTWLTAIIPEIRILLGDPKGSVRLVPKSRVVSRSALTSLVRRRLFTQVSVLLGTATILIFLCLVLLPRVRGVNPNVSFHLY